MFPLRCANALGDTLKSLAFHAHAKGIELAWHVDSEVPEHVMGDPTRLNQIIVNLVGNAIKFTSSGEVVLRVSDSRIDDHQVRLHITVSDTGIGIAPAQMEKIFSAFQQADTSTTRQFGGTGLGLSISSRLAELMHGEIWVESEPTKGSTFHVDVQLDIDSSSLTTTADSMQICSGRRVLVVDDNATNRLILVENLKSWEMDVSAVDSGAAALALLQQGPESKLPDLVISDHQMPQMDGVEMIEAIRGCPVGRNCP